MDPRNIPRQAVFNLPTPAAATGFTITPDSGGDWLIRSVRFQLVTDANAADRAVALTLSAGGTEYARFSASAVQAASLTRIYVGVEGIGASGSVGTFTPIAMPGNGIWLPKGHALTVTTANIQAGDQFSVIAGYRVEFPHGPDEHVWPFYPVLLEKSS